MPKKTEEKFRFPIPEDGAWQMMQKKDTNDPDAFFKAEEEGELSVDVYQNEKEIVIKTAIAGVSRKDLEISLNHDLLTIRGNRKLEEDVDENNYFHQECYWGKFSRSLILPIEVEKHKTKAQLKNGVLTIILPKITKDAGIIKVKEIE
ncbi:MAG: Hsp20/alpha crystallin family protein [Patescibacteria group bacterium]|nr:Hsp20/alpha crystallin family protein [Patescibacteria group bacterium]